MVRAFLLCAVSALVLLAHASAQSTTQSAPQRQAQWYQAQLVELSQALGGAHYLRLSCTRADYAWFNFMEGVMAREHRAPRRMLEDAFNDGFRRERARFGRCTGIAQQMEAELRARAMRAADALGAVHDDVSPP